MGGSAQAANEDASAAHPILGIGARRALPAGKGGGIARMKTILLALAGFLLLAFAAVGLALPVWPTTPFVLAAAACFAGMPRMRAWLLRLPVFGEHIRNYQTRAGLTRRTMAVSLAFLWGMLALSAALIRKPWVLALLFVVGAAVTVHLAVMARPRRGSGAPEGEAK